jgi:hypothetical protein
MKKVWILLVLNTHLSRLFTLSKIRRGDGLVLFMWTTLWQEFGTQKHNDDVLLDFLKWMPCQFQKAEHQNRHGTPNVTELTNGQVLDVCTTKIILLCSEINAVYGRFRPFCSTGPLVDNVRLLEQSCYFRIFKIWRLSSLKINIKIKLIP